MSDKDVVHGKVARYLKEIFPKATERDDKSFTVPFESTRIWISIEDYNIPKSEKTKAWHATHSR